MSNEGNYSTFTREMTPSDSSDYTQVRKSTNAEGNLNFLHF